MPFEIGNITAFGSSLPGNEYFNECSQKISRILNEDQKEYVFLHDLKMKGKNNVEIIVSV